ncbi:MAG: Tim44/TimA family putative adaptor protein [Alphaproteobacteria bacterium]|nr:Tim44/TimA family putative adaptor protein [Alphaproteobacteria bacterium]
MFIENIILGGIIAFLVFVLYKSLGKQSLKQPQLPEKLRFISEKTGQVVEMKLLKEPLNLVEMEKMNQQTFLLKAKMIFQSVCESFAGGDLAVLRSQTDTAVFEAFEKLIKERQERGEKMEFTLVCFNKAEVIHTSEQKDKITVCFETEQINILKDSKGNVIEGDAMSIAKTTDFWTFKKIKNKWVLNATQSEAFYE